jgi:hypothetical protein
VGVDEGHGPILFRLALSVAQFQGGPPGSFWVGTDLFRASKAKRMTKTPITETTTHVICLRRDPHYQTRHTHTYTSQPAASRLGY